MNWMSILGICLIVLGTIFSFVGTYQSDKKSQHELSYKIQEKNKKIEEINDNNIKLISQNSALLSSSKNVSTTNQDLIDQNTQMLSRVSEYQKDIEERDKQIKALENEVDNVKEYGYYANLDIYGRSFIPGVGIKLSSDLSNRMGKILIVVEIRSLAKLPER